MPLPKWERVPVLFLLQEGEEVPEEPEEEGRHPKGWQQTIEGLAGAEGGLRDSVLQILPMGSSPRPLVDLMEQQPAPRGVDMLQDEEKAVQAEAR